MSIKKEKIFTKVYTMILLYASLILIALSTRIKTVSSRETTSILAREKAISSRERIQI